MVCWLIWQSNLIILNSSFRGTLSNADDAKPGVPWFVRQAYNNHISRRSWRARKSKHFDERDMGTHLRLVLYAREVVVFPVTDWSEFFYRQRNCRIGPGAHWIVAQPHISLATVKSYESWSVREHQNQKYAYVGKPLRIVNPELLSTNVPISLRGSQLPIHHQNKHILQHLLYNPFRLSGTYWMALINFALPTVNFLSRSTPKYTQLFDWSAMN